MGPELVHVLIASSDRAYAATLADFLARRGMAVLRLTGEPAGPETLAPIDVLLVETHGLASGEWELIDGIRQAAPLVEVVAISSEPVVRDAVGALRSGAFAVLEYPVSSEQLEQTIRDAAGRKRRAQARILELNQDQPWERVARPPLAPPTDRERS
jgi:DNA-binding NtrC family response regulator